MSYNRPTSFSQNNMFWTCPRSWYMKYVQKIPGIDDLKYAHRGNVVHHCLEKYYPDKTMTTAEVKVLFETEWKTFGLDNTSLKNKKDETWLMILRGMELDLDFTSTELKIWYPDVVGYIDAVNTKKGIYSDWKSSTLSEHNKNEYTMQLKYYAWLYYRKFNKVPIYCNVYYLKYTGTKGEFGFTPTTEDIENAKKWHYKTRERMGYFIDHPERLPPFNKGYFFCPYKHLWDLDSKSPTDLMKFVIDLYGNFFYIKGDVDNFLSNHFAKKYSYELKTAFFIKKANPNANTTIRFWLESKRRLPIGFLTEVMKSLHDYAEFKKKIPVIAVNDKRYIDKTIVEMPDELLSGKTLRPYQIDAIDTYVNRNKIGMLELSTGSGKSLIAAEIVRRLRCKTLFVVDKKELLYQMKKTFEENLGIEIGVIGDGKKDIKDVTVATIQTLNKNIADFKEYLGEVRFVIMDEVHKIASKSYYKLGSYMKNTEYRLGLCLNPSTNVFDDKGHIKKIKDIKVGEKILSYNHVTKLAEPKKVLNVFKKQIDEKYEIIVKTKRGNRKIVCSGKHKFFVDGIYCEAEKLNIGNKVILLDSPHSKLAPNSQSTSTREKLSKALKGRVFTEEHCKNLSQSLKGHIPWNKNTIGLQQSHRKGISLIDEYGKEKAKKIKTLMKENGKRLWKDRHDELVLNMNNKKSKTSNKPFLFYNRRIKINMQSKDNNIICEKCNKCINGYKHVHCHHIDKNYKNNNLNNLMILCARCHFKIHDSRGERTRNIVGEFK